jgi:hypothetical protein
MAGKLSRKKLGDGFDLPPPVITEANRAMMEASGGAAVCWLMTGLGGAAVCWPRNDLARLQCAG